MDIEELIQGTLKLAEKQEMEATHEPSLYTYKLDTNSHFSDMVCYGDISVLASNFEVASLLFFLLEGYYEDQKWDWYTNKLQEWIVKYGDSIQSEEWDGDITCEVAYDLWSKHSHGIITQHNLLAPIRIKHYDRPSHSENSGLDTYVVITPALSEIWTLTRFRRNLIG